MPQENQSEIFIRLLRDVVQADRLQRRSTSSLTLQTDAKRMRRTTRRDHAYARHDMSTLDCVQMMAAGLSDPQSG